MVKPDSYSRQEPSRSSSKLYIYCEGSKREYDYFKYFVNRISNIDIIPIKSKNGKTDPLKLKESALNDFEPTESIPKYVLDKEQGDEIWFVFDTDQWGEKIVDLRSFCEQKDAWFVAQSNPCFEIWLYYHFYVQKPVAEDVAKFESMKAFVDNQIPGGFDCRKMPKMIDTAINNSKGLFTQENGQPSLYCTEVFKIGEIIRKFITF
ncbi:MAG: RloB family protein [Treponema sp.]|nr:RloB family protein [Treponema sp.]